LPGTNTTLQKFVTFRRKKFHKKVIYVVNADTLWKKMIFSPFMTFSRVTVIRKTVIRKTVIRKTVIRKTVIRTTFIRKHSAE
jgi:hypothetical protein